MLTISSPKGPGCKGHTLTSHGSHCPHRGCPGAEPPPAKVPVFLMTRNFLGSRAVILSLFTQPAKVLSDPGLHRGACWIQIWGQTLFQKEQGLGISQVELKTERSRKKLRGSGDLGSKSGPAQPPETEDKEGNCCLGSGSKTQKEQTSVKVSTCFFKLDLQFVCRNLDMERRKEQGHCLENNWPKI